MSLSTPRATVAVGTPRKFAKVFCFVLGVGATPVGDEGAVALAQRSAVDGHQSTPSHGQLLVCCNTWATMARWHSRLPSRPQVRDVACTPCSIGSNLAGQAAQLEARVAPCANSHTFFCVVYVLYVLAKSVYKITTQSKTLARFRLAHMPPPRCRAAPAQRARDSPPTATRGVLLPRRPGSRHPGSRPCRLKPLAAPRAPRPQGEGRRA